VPRGRGGNVARLDPNGTLLGDFDLDRGKGCIRFKRRNAISDSRVALLPVRCMVMKRAGTDTGCQGRAGLHAPELGAKWRQWRALACAVFPWKYTFL